VPNCNEVHSQGIKAPLRFEPQLKQISPLK